MPKEVVCGKKCRHCLRMWQASRSENRSPVWSWQDSRWNTGQRIGHLCQAKYWTGETNKNHHKSKNHDYFERKYWMTWLVFSQEEGLWSEWRREEGSIYAYLYTLIFIYIWEYLGIHVQIQDIAKRKEKSVFCLQNPKEQKSYSSKKTI